MRLLVVEPVDNGNEMSGERNWVLNLRVDGDIKLSGLEGDFQGETKLERECY